MDFNYDICKVNIKQGLHVLDRNGKKTLLVHYVGVAIANISEDDTVEVRFFKRQPSKHDTSIFFFPDTVDSDEVDIDDIVMLLPPLIPSGGTKIAAKTCLQWCESRCIQSGIAMQQYVYVEHGHIHDEN